MPPWRTTRVAPAAVRATPPRDAPARRLRSIFGTETADAGPKIGARSNKSNQSSVAGGIFGQDAPMRAPPSRNGRNPNQSSIEGGIFG